MVALRSTVDDAGAGGPVVVADAESEQTSVEGVVVVDVATLLDAAGPPPPPAPSAISGSAPAMVSGGRTTSAAPPPTRARVADAPSAAAPLPVPAAPAGQSEMSSTPAAHAPSGRIAVPTRRQRRAARRLQARKVGRIVRHLDLWSVLKLSLLFHLSAFLISMVAGVLLWSVGISSGVIGDLEGFIRAAFALQSFAFDGERIFRAAVLGGLALVLAATALSVLLAAMFNLMSDLVGGIRVTVVEEETARPRRARPPRPA